ncbi:aldo/keto reductase [Halobacteriales archaeon SW_7_68_16]|nr:MAG: aldo/keto reductase [Halobacteriales archaeon SW_7_68_16]
MATGSATWAYRDRFHESFGRTYFRRYGDGVVSSVGLGTYLGDATDAVDDRYHEAIRTAIENGCNVVDTAINYRCQRSERAVGAAIADADVDREAVLVATKGGFVPFDGERPDDPGQYVRETYVEPGIVGADDLVEGSHSLAPTFITDQFGRSLSNLGLDTIDLYYLHNPETQLAVRSVGPVYDRIEAAFEVLEERIAAGELRGYGVATWACFRVGRDGDPYLSLPEIVRRARAAADAVGNETTGFRAIQVPFNVLMADAFTVTAQPGPDGDVSVLQFAREAQLAVVTSATLARGQLTAPGTIPEDVAARLAGETPAQRAINFARSAPGVTSALVGSTDSEHVAENVAAGEFDPMGADAFDATFE